MKVYMFVSCQLVTLGAPLINHLRRAPRREASTCTKPQLCHKRVWPEESLPLSPRILEGLSRSEGFNFLSTRIKILGISPASVGFQAHLEGVFFLF